MPNINKNKLIIFGPYSTPHTEAWSNLICRETYSLMGVTVHQGPASYPIISIRGEPFGKFRFVIGILMLAALRLRYPGAQVLAHYYSSYAIASIFTFARPIVFCWGSDVNLLHTKFPQLANLVGWITNKRAKALVVPSSSIKQKLLASGVDEEKLHVLQYGIDIPKLKSLRGSMLNETNGLHIASIRNGKDLYQIEKIIEAFKLAKFKSESATLHIFGSGHDCQSGVSKYGSKKTIIFHGLLPKNDFYSRVGACDAFVSIPTRDGLSLSVLEALYLGLVPVLSDVGSYRELFLELQPFFVEANSTPKQLAKVLAEVMRNASLNDQRRQVIRQNKTIIFMENNFSMEYSKRKLADILSNLLETER